MHGSPIAPPGRPWRAWVIAARVPTLTAAVAPVLVGTAAGASGGGVHPWRALAALVVAVSIQIGTNFANDAFDFLRGADTPDRGGPLRVTQSGLLSPRQVLRGAYLCFVLAGLAGAWFVALYGWPVLAGGLLAIASGLGYTGGPWPIAYHGLGELFVFLFFGVMAVAGSAYVQVGSVSALAAGASVPVGLLATAILILNNLRDIGTDKAAGKRTLPVRMGASGARALYLFCLTGAAIAPAGLRMAGLTPNGFWLPWLAVPLMLAPAHAALRARGGPALTRALAQTAGLHLVFSVLLAASLVW